MPFVLSIENEGSGAFITWKGVVSGKEIKIGNQAIYSQDQRHLLRYQIWDFTIADKVGVSNDELRTIVWLDEHAAIKTPNQRVAIVGTRELFLYRSYTQVWSGFESETFVTVAEARMWIAGAC